MKRGLSTFLRGLAAEFGAPADARLVDQLLARRDEAAFAAVLHRHGPMVYRVCWRVLRQAEDAEDAFQATFLLLAQRLGSLRRPESLASWLHGVAHRVALQARRRAAARRRREAAAPPREAPPDDLGERELLAALDEELARLPERWRLPVILCHLEGRTQDEAALQLGWGKNTLRRRLQEAREALGRRLARRGVAAPAALSGWLLSECVASALPPRLLAQTASAASQVAAGLAALSAFPAEVAALTEGVQAPMAPTKLKVMAALLLGVAVAVAGVGVARDAPRGGERPDDKLDPPAKKAEDREKWAKAERKALKGTWQRKDKKNGDVALTFDEEGMHLRWKPPEGYDGWGGETGRGVKLKCEPQRKDGKSALVLTLPVKRKRPPLDKPFILPYRLKGDTLTLDGKVFELGGGPGPFLKAELKGEWKRLKEQGGRKKE